MGKKSDIIVVGPAGLSPRVMAALKRKGYDPREFGSVREVTEETRVRYRPTILISCHSEDETGKEIISLRETPDIHLVPILFIGRGIRSHINALEELCPFIELVNYPCQERKLISAIVELAEFAAENDPDDLRASIAPSARIEVKNSPSETPAPANPDEQISETLSRIGNIGDKAGGYELVRSFGPETFEKMGLTPEDPGAAEAVDKVLEKGEERDKTHLYRVSFVSNNIGTNLQLHSALKESAKAASFLYAHSFIDQKDLMRRDYLNDMSSSIRTELASKISHSAEQIREELDSDDVSQIIKVVGQLVAGDKHSASDEIGLVASSIVAGDLLDRSCWKSGRWSPNGAYSLMHRLRSGTKLSLHPDVRASVLLTLTEAANSEASRFLLPKLPKLYRELLQGIRNSVKVPLSENEVAIRVTDLRPGMEVSQPVVAFDGTTILPSGILLDNDLILRLWQLTAVKPLLVPYVVLAENEAFEIQGLIEEADDENHPPA